MVSETIINDSSSDNATPLANWRFFIKTVFFFVLGSYCINLKQRFFNNYNCLK